jgi:hypothetical protein
VLSFRNSTRFIAAAALAVAIGILVDAHNTSNASAPNALAAGAALPKIWHGPTSAHLSSILFGGRYSRSSPQSPHSCGRRRNHTRSGLGNASAHSSAVLCLTDRTAFVPVSGCPSTSSP